MSTRISVEISLYPLTPDYKPPIREFIARLKANSNLTVVSNTMSTQIQGDYDEVWDALKREKPGSLDKRRTDLSAQAEIRLYVHQVLGCRCVLGRDAHPLGTDD